MLTPLPSVTNFKRLRVIKLILLSAVFILCGCTSDIDRKLSEADHIICISPDSALNLLNDLEIPDEDERHGALHALLTAKASVKSHKPINTDLPLEMAVRFYENRGDSLEIQSLYYYGRSLLKQGLSSKALSIFTLSYDVACLNNDHYYAGLCAREITKLYDRFLTSKAQLNWAEEEKRRFVKAGKTAHALWADLDILRAYSRNNMPDSTLELAARIDSGVMNANHDFRVLMNSEKALALWKLNRFEEAGTILRQQVADGSAGKMAESGTECARFCRIMCSILPNMYIHTLSIPFTPPFIQTE